MVTQSHYAMTYFVISSSCGFKMGNTEPAEAVETLFLDSEFFENRVQGTTKEVRLKKWCPRASPKEKALFPVANEIKEHGRNGRVQVHLVFEHRSYVWID
jgi:hypothetical protein